MTESELAASIKTICDQFAKNDSIGQRAELPGLFGQLGTMIEAHQNHIGDLKSKVAQLERQLREVEGKHGLA